MDCLVLGMCFGALGALEPILGNFLVAQFEISQQSIAYVFIIPTAAYPITVFCMNAFLKRVPEKAKMCLGLILVGFAMIIAGPCTLTGISPTIYITLGSLVFLGAGMAFAMIPSLPDMLTDATEQLSHIDKSLLSDRLSGLVSLSLYFGKATAAPFAGFLKLHINFQDSIAIFGLIVLTYALIFGVLGGGFKAMAGHKTYKTRAETLLSEKEMVESRKSFYLLEEDEV